MLKGIQIKITWWRVCLVRISATLGFDSYQTRVEDFLYLVFRTPRWSSGGVGDLPVELLRGKPPRGVLGLAPISSTSNAFRGRG